MREHNLSYIGRVGKNIITAVSKHRSFDYFKKVCTSDDDQTFARSRVRVLELRERFGTTRE